MKKIGGFGGDGGREGVEDGAEGVEGGAEESRKERSEEARKRGRRGRWRGRGIGKEATENINLVKNTPNNLVFKKISCNFGWE